MITWVNMLHIYQPPTQEKPVIDIVVRESYEKILSLLNQYPALRLTINMPGSLLELLSLHKYTHIIDGFKKYAEEGRVELMGTAMYHPILALLPKEEIRRQIELHNNISTYYFGNAYKPQGFFAPEMAYNDEVGKIVKEMGYEWILLDPIHTRERINASTHYTDKTSGIGVIFRNKTISQTFPPEYICTHIKEIDGTYLITAHDGEMYGHKHVDDRGFFHQSFNNPDIRTVTASEYFFLEKPQKQIELVSGSWETTLEERDANIPFSVWNAPHNNIHEALWHLAHITIGMVQKHSNDPHFTDARKNLDRGLASCYWWWASERKLGVFSPPAWNPSDIEKGATLLLNACRSLTHLSKKDRLFAEQIFLTVHTLIWERHWNIVQ